MTSFKALLIVWMLCLLVSACNATTTPDPAAIEFPTVTPTAAPPTVVMPIYTVQHGDMLDALTAVGRVAAAQNQDAFFKVDGFLQVVHVERGDSVTQGQILAELDPGDLPREISQAQAEIASIEEQISHAAQQQELRLQSAELALEDAQGTLEVLQQPPSDLDVRAANLAIEQAEIDLEGTRRDASTAKTSAELNMERAANAVRNVQATYSDIYNDQSYQRQEDKEQDLARAQRAIEDAEAGLEIAKRAYEVARDAEISQIRQAEQDLERSKLALDELLTPPTSQEIAAAERAVQQAEVRLQEARLEQSDPGPSQQIQRVQRNIAEMQAQMNQYQLYAPFAGEVAEVMVKGGDQVAAFAPVVNIINPAELALALSDILPTDLDKINIGQEVSITFARYPDQTIPGQVIRLPASASGAGGDVIIRGDPNLWIGFDANELELEVGDLGDVTITFADHPDTLWLPSQAVRSFAGQAFVVLRDGSEERRVDVKVGIVADDKMEILEGLKEGDVVVAP